MEISSLKELTAAPWDVVQRWFNRTMAVIHSWDSWRFKEGIEKTFSLTHTQSSSSMRYKERKRKQNIYAVVVVTITPAGGKREKDKRSWWQMNVTWRRPPWQKSLKTIEHMITATSFGVAACLRCWRRWHLRTSNIYLASCIDRRAARTSIKCTPTSREVKGQREESVL